MCLNFGCGARGKWIHWTEVKWCCIRIDGIVRPFFTLTIVALVPPILFLVFLILFPLFSIPPPSPLLRLYLIVNNELAQRFQ